MTRFPPVGRLSELARSLPWSRGRDGKQPRRWSWDKRRGADSFLYGEQLKQGRSIEPRLSEVASLSSIGRKRQASTQLGVLLEGCCAPRPRRSRRLCRLGVAGFEV